MRWDHHPSHGFRFSATDAIAILLFGAATAAGLWILGSVAWLIAFVAGHFFLFCNVFRIPRFLELTWAGCFLAVASICLVLDVEILHVMWLTPPFTLGILWYGVRRPEYRGIGSRKPDAAA